MEIPHKRVINTNMFFHAALHEFYLYTNGIQNILYEVYINVVVSMHNSFVVSDFVMTPKKS